MKTKFNIMFYKKLTNETFWGSVYRPHWDIYANSWPVLTWPDAPFLKRSFRNESSNFFAFSSKFKKEKLATPDIMYQIARDSAIFYPIIKNLQSFTYWRGNKDIWTSTYSYRLQANNTTTKRIHHRFFSVDFWNFSE